MQTREHQPQRVRGVDRLSAVATRRWLIGLAALGVACSGDAKPPGKTEAVNNRRVNAVAAAAKPAEATAGFCERQANPEQAQTFSFPPLAGAAPTAVAGWRWVNVWATWCKPCIAEMPMMARWRERFRDDKLDVDVTFLSVDDSQAAIDRFAPKHPDVPTDGPRIANVDGLEPWLASIGLSANSVLPIHLFVDPQNKLRCVRMGGVSAEDYGAIKHVIASG
ncbi:MAG: redoxin domain-containing protein [Myxococcales bacterium FL481]|nr:MAG: redoxin domain-containing protein [Myxococcales bacterium FL481]